MKHCSNTAYGLPLTQALWDVTFPFVLCSNMLLVLLSKPFTFILVWCYCAFVLSCEPHSSAVLSLFLCHLFDPSLSALSGITSLQVSSEGIEYNLTIIQEAGSLFGLFGSSF